MLRLPRQTPIDELRDKTCQKFRESESIELEWADALSRSDSMSASDRSSALSLYYRTVPSVGATTGIASSPAPPSPRGRSASISSTNTSLEQSQTYVRIQSGEDWARALAGAAPGEKLVLRLDAGDDAVEVV